MIDGESYLRLGEIYYDTLRKYELSQAYYDSTIMVLPKDYEGYSAIKSRQEVLNEFVKNLNTITWQDSLLRMANLDSAQLMHRIDSVLEVKRLLAEKKAVKKKKKQSNRVDLSSPQSVFGNADGTTDESVGWYFGNPTAMAVGQTEFKRLWGDVPLDDNWRRSQRAATASSATTSLDADATNQGNDENQSTEDMANPAVAEFERLNKEIPRTEDQKQEALTKIEDAYFNLGDIYYFKLLEKDNAIIYYLELLNRFPETTHEPEVLYKLYLITKEIDSDKAEHYATTLKEKHPTSAFAKILINPDYLKEESEAAEKQKTIYKTAYEYFLQENYTASSKSIQEAETLGQTLFTPNLELLKVLIIGRIEDINQYQYALDQYLKKYPDTEPAAYAKKLLAASREFQKKKETAKGIQYIPSLEEPHYFVIVHKKAENMSNQATSALEKFNQSNFKALKLKTSNLVLNDEYSVTLVADMPKASAAMQYQNTFNEKLSSLTELRNHKFHNFVITKDNFDIFYRTKGLDEYLQFFEKNYPSKN